MGCGEIRLGVYGLSEVCLDVLNNCFQATNANC